MPTKKILDSDRRRCAQACDNCKRRKQRCDGRRPCVRCIQRGLRLDCQTTSVTSTSRPIVASSLPSPVPERIHSENGPTLPHAAQTPPLASPSCDAYGHDDTPSSEALSQALPAKVPQMSRLVKDTKGEYMFIGDSAILSFLQNIRRIVRRCIGDCAFVDDPLRHLIVEVSPETRRGWVMSSAQNPPPKQTAEEANYLQKWFMRSANCVLLLFDAKELECAIRVWLGNGCDKADPASSVYYLVFAIGAQEGPKDKDSLAESFFNYARYLTVETHMENPDITTIQTFSLITMYLLAASRRNSAFMYLGMAVRAAYALGLHRKDVSLLFSEVQCATRERLWKAIRILDLFMSASLGRPPSTSETRDTGLITDYSACNDLSMIFESILSDVYTKRMVSADVLDRISKHHRHWSFQCSSGLSHDGIEQNEFIDDPVDGKRPNIGLIHLKQTAYWTILLLSLPFLLKAVSNHIEASEASPSLLDGTERASSSFPHRILVQSCIESAILTVDTLQTLVTAETIPKRLPFVVNSVFLSGLVLGVAVFGDLDTSFPLPRSFSTSRRVLSRFVQYDPVAKRHLMILDHLHLACESYMETRARRKMNCHGYLIGGIFGSVHAIGKPLQHDCSSNDVMEPHMSPSSFTQCPQSIPLFSALDMCLNHNNHNKPDVVSVQHRMDADGQSHGDIPSVNFSDITAAMSPSMLWFDSFDTMHLFPTIDANAMESNIASHEL